MTTLFAKLVASSAWAKVPPHIAAALKELDGHYRQVLKTHDEQRIVVGWASVAALGDGTPVVDSNGDIITLESLVTAVAEYAQTDAALWHRHGKHGKVRIGTILEHYVLTPATKEALGLHPATCLGYLIAARVDDLEEWNNAKNGELPMFSIGALVTRQETKARLFDRLARAG